VSSSRVSTSVPRKNGFARIKAGVASVKTGRQLKPLLTAVLALGLPLVAALASASASTSASTESDAGFALFAFFLAWCFNKPFWTAVVIGFVAGYVSGFLALLIFLFAPNNPEPK
jgi:RsiW-degrading membrane proteinase PrsW (M82 family)